jgi:hypothetical protein
MRVVAVEVSERASSSHDVRRSLFTPMSVGQPAADCEATIASEGAPRRGKMPPKSSNIAASTPASKGKATSISLAYTALAGASGNLPQLLHSRLGLLLVLPLFWTQLQIFRAVSGNGSCSITLCSVYIDLIAARRALALCRPSVRFNLMAAAGCIGSTLFKWRVNQDILRLEVPMVNPNGVAVFHGIEDLEEGGLGYEAMPDVLTLLSDVGEQITFRAIFSDHEDAVMGIEDFH